MQNSEGIVTEAPPEIFRHVNGGAVYRVVRRYKALGGTLPCVVGHTFDGRRQTVAREVDVIFLKVQAD